MAGIINENIRRPSRDLIVRFERLPTSVVSDMMNRMNAMHSAIKPLCPGTRIVGPAVTVKTMAGDNLMTHHAIYCATEGDVLVIDGRAHLDTAIWGQIQTIACQKQKLCGVVVDGAVRDVADLRTSGFPVFARATTPAGPHKGWGGSINTPIQCGGVSVSPGDVIIGDDDGVIAVPQAELTNILERSLERLEEEDEWRRRIEAGESTLEILGLDKKLQELNMKGTSRASQARGKNWRKEQVQR